MGVFGMVGILRYCLFWFLSLSVLTAEASRQKPVVRPASAQDVFVKGGTTLDINRHWGEILDVPGGRVDLPVTQKSAYNPTRIAGAIKQLIKNNPLKVAGTAAGLALIHQLPGANFDPLTGAPVFSTPIVQQGTHWRFLYTGQSQYHPGYFSTDLQACQSYNPNGSPTYRIVKIHESSSQCYRTVYGNEALVGNSHRLSFNCPHGFNTSTGSCNSTSPAPLPMTESQLDQLVAGVPGFSESHWSEIGPILLSDIPATFDGPDFQEFTGLDQVTGTPTITTTLDQVSGTTTVVESTPVHSFDYSTNPLSITTTTTTTNNTYQNGTLVSTTTQTQGQPSTEVSEVPAQLEIPTDCDFMPTVCSFIDWVKTPFNEEEPDLSDLIADEDFEKEINFSSNATCPGPSMISTSHGDFEFSWEPGCQWAGMIKPLIIIAALVAAIFINLGTARGPE